MNHSRIFRLRETFGAPVLAAALSAIFTTGAFAVDTILHNFTGGASDGSQPYGALTVSGSTLYGMTSSGGSASDGTIFTESTSGSGFGVLHSFTGSDGAFPMGSLLLSSSTLYGMTLGDGNDNQGTIFSMSPSGSGFTVLHTFTGSTSDGGRPFGSLIAIGSKLYGMTSTGGTGNDGAIFGVNSDGTGFSLLHSFAGGASDGMGPQGSLLVRGSTLFGMTRYGGTSNQGTMFSLGTSGTGYIVLHNFTGGSSDGAQPFGTLVSTFLPNQLVGVTEQGGSSGEGTLFYVNTNGSNFFVEHSFTGGISDGAFPLGSPYVLGSSSFVMTEQGGTSNNGVAFAIGVGTAYQILQNFAGPTSDGASPQGDFATDPSNPNPTILYGMTDFGGSSNQGVVFSVSSGLPEPASAGLCTLGALLLTARRRR